MRKTGLSVLSSIVLFVWISGTRVTSAKPDLPRNMAWVSPILPYCKHRARNRLDISMEKDDVRDENNIDGKEDGEEMWVQAFLHDLHRKSKMFGRQHVQLKIKGEKVPSWRGANQFIRDRYVFMAPKSIDTGTPSEYT
jgi:hypothetical protein